MDHLTLKQYYAYFIYNHITLYISKIFIKKTTTVHYPYGAL